MGHYLVLFDGRCRFCRGQVKLLRALDWRDRLGFRPLGEAGSEGLNPGQMYVVGPDGRALGGASGVRMLSRVVPVLWLAAPFLYIPFSLPVWQFLYKQVARNRYRLGRTCDDGECAT